MTNLPLKGLVVLEFSQYLSGPSAGLRLADLGARVIKIERPGTGDASRKLSIKNLWVDDSSLLFHTVNRDKEGFTANLKDAGDLELVKKLITKADVLIHNFRPGVMQKTGLGYTAVKEINPRLIYAAISGYGTEGPWKAKPGQWKCVFLWALAQFIYSSLFAQTEVPQSVMQQIYQEIKTPYKYGMVITPADSTKKVDCPSVFRKGNNWYMTYIVFDGRGYETWLAKSKNLLEWKILGRILSFGNSSREYPEWDVNQRAGYIALQDNKWGGSYQLQKYNGKYWMSYIGGKDKGYESGPLAIGVANTNSNPAKAHDWKRLGDPVLAVTDIDIRWWENRKLFKSSIIWDKSNTLGHPFVMYYNANGDTSNNTPKWRWFERIGMAVSDDMINWQRYQTDPVVHHPIGITGDGVVQKINDIWVMFYFGAFWEGRKDAFNRFACSYDLVNWTDWNGDDLIKSSEPFDAKYAHKPYVVKWKGVVYHFYCAVDKKDTRGIAVATSKALIPKVSLKLR